MNSRHKGQWCRALMFFLICVWTNGWVNSRDGDYCFTVMDNCCARAKWWMGRLMHEMSTVIHVLFSAFFNDFLVHVMKGSCLYDVPQIANCSGSPPRVHRIPSTVYWCIASKLKAARNLYWMSNMFLWVEIFLFFVCYHVFPKRHSQLDYELNDL